MRESIFYVSLRVVAAAIAHGAAQRCMHNVALMRFDILVGFLRYILHLLNLYVT